MSLSVPARLGAFVVLAGLGTAGAVSLLVPPGAASVTGAARRPATGSGDAGAVRLLREAADAADATAYSGVQYLSSWGSDGASTSVVIEVTHVPGKGSMVQVRPTPGSGGLEVYENDQDDRTQGMGGQNLAGGRGQALALLERKYDVELAAREDVAGRPADVVEVRRPDGSLAARLWLDAATKMLVRREITDARGRMTRASAFVELRVGRTGLPAMVSTDSPTEAVRPWDRRLEPADLARLRDRGWAVPGTLPGGLELYDARSDDHGGEVVHLSFSDGLSTVSLFEQKGRLDPRRFASWRRESIGGARVYVRDTLPRRVVWASRGKVYTVLADAPEDTVDAIVGRLPHSTPRNGVLPRLGRGLARVGSWLNPFS